MAEAPVRSALVITASDGAAAGVREDTSGARVGERLEAPADRPARAEVGETCAAAGLDAAVRLGGMGLDRPALALQ